MPEWLGFVLFIAAYVVLMKLVVPRFGARRCMFGSCRIESRSSVDTKSSAK